MSSERAKQAAQRHSELIAAACLANDLRRKLQPRTCGCVLPRDVLGAQFRCELLEGHGGEHQAPDGYGDWVLWDDESAR